jgi:hypothetical protein
VRKILALVILLAVLTGLDLLARNVAEQQVVDQVKSELTGNAKVSASIPTFPFVPRLVFRGSVPKVTVKVKNLAGPPINLAEVDLAVRGVLINRHDLWNKRRVELEAIDKGVVGVDVTQDALSDVLGMPVKISGGQVRFTLAGQTVTATPSITKDNRLMLTPVGGGPARSVGLGQAKIVPCAGSVTVLDGKVRVSCTFTHIPDAMVRAAKSK